MKILDELLIKKLSFPDFEVEKTELSLKEKKLKIFTEGAWLDTDGGIQLGEGFLFFSDWKSISIKKFNANTEQWSLIEDSFIESLKDLCEIKFVDSVVFLNGFGKETGNWMEWEIAGAKIEGEFIF